MVAFSVTFTPLDAWGIFLLYFPEDQIRIICRNTNQYMDLNIKAQKDDPNLPPHARIRRWYDMTVPEAYGYLGIRIYMGIHQENQAKDYWRLRSNQWPDHPVSSLLGLQRHEAIHTSWRLCDTDPDQEFKAIFERVSLILLYPHNLLTYWIVRTYEHSFLRGISSLLDPRA